MQTRKILTVFLAVAGLSALACVIRTEHKIEAHIVLDIRHVEADASAIEDMIADDMDLGALNRVGVEMKGVAAAGPSLPELLARLLDPASTASAAEKPSIELTPELKAIIERRKARLAELERQKATGCVGEKNDAYTAYRPCEACEKDAEKKTKVEELVKDENADRKAMFKEYAKQKGAGESEIPKIQAVWAETYRAKAKPGHWIQAPSRIDQLRAFQKTKLGAKLDKVKAGQWYQVPKEGSGS
jgi:uncharacterized protein YdbL (DUF1318 family)